LQRITQAGLANKVFPFRAEAHALPYAKKQFDAIISVDAYQYFGTDDLYLAYFSEFLKPGGLLGLVMAGWTRDFDGGSQYWPERIDMRLFGNFHTLEWWRSHLEYPGIVKIESAEHLPNVKQIWQDSARAMYDTKKILRAADGTSPEDTRKELDFWQGDIDFLEADKDNYSTIMAVSAIKI
jgi:SAM-dependent methyltransferase